MATMASQKPLVLILGATGNTGSSIVNGLLTSGNFVRITLLITTKVLPVLTRLFLHLARRCYRAPLLSHEARRHRPARSGH